MKPTWLLCALLIALPGSGAAPRAMAQTAAATALETPAQAQAEIWALEQAIYAGRANGDLTAYIDHTAPDYLSWPPTMKKPMRMDVLQHSAATMHPKAHEVLTMQFVDFSLHGNVAVIYYTTHRTQRSDGTASDDHFETTHTWVRENGKWMVLAGMARPVPAPNP
jgi:ketosteroid isomerase-like protein